MSGLYNYRWQQARLVFLTKNPICVRCHSLGTITKATVVDHIEPHKEDKILFWDRTNWQAMCDNCHSSYKQRLEKTGKVAGCSAKGIPIDPNHHWNKQKYRVGGGGKILTTNPALEHLPLSLFAVGS